MKISKLNIIVLLLAIIPIWYGCEEETEPVVSKVEFAFNYQSNNNQRLKYNEGAASILISVEDENGNKIYDRKSLEVYSFNDSYLSEPIDLNPGKYKLTGFLVLDAKGNVIYATPKEGSKFAYLVEDPLPIGFSTQSNITSKVNPQVISVSSLSPEDLGYSTFTFDIVSTVDFLLSVFTYDPATENLELTTANLIVTNLEDDKVLFNQSVSDSTNLIRIVDSYDNILIKVEKEGYDTFTYHTTKTELENHKLKPFIVTLFNGISLSEGLIAHFSFNGHTNDVSGNQLNGVAQGGSFVSDKNNNANQAYYFDGIDDHIRINNNELFENQQFTISSWIATENDTGAVLSFSRVPNGNNNSGYYLQFLESKPAGRFSLNSNSHTWARIQAENKIQHTTWEHLVFTYDQEYMKIYLNGELIAITPETRGIDYLEHNPIIIGGYATTVTGGTWLKGKMDEIKVYNRALSSLEVQALSRQ